MTQLIDAIFGVLVSHTPTALFGEQFGKARLVGKRFNLDREMVIGHMPALTVAFMKDVVTQEGKIEVNEKNVPQYDYFFKVWFVAASNQLASLPQNTDRKAWFRRTLIDVLDKTQKKAPGFKSAVVAEKDAIFTNLLLNKPCLIPPEDVEAHVNTMSELWDFWSNPVLRICKEHLEYYEGGAGLDVEALVSLVGDALAGMKINMNRRDVQSTLTESLKQFKCYRAGRRLRNYKNIRIKPEDEEWIEAYKGAVEDETVKAREAM